MTMQRKDTRLEVVKACSMSEPNKSITLSYTDTVLLGQGAFGVVTQAKLCHNGQVRERSLNDVTMMMSLFILEQGFILFFRKKFYLPTNYTTHGTHNTGEK